MKEINAIAYKMIQEAMRLKTPMLSICSVVLLLIYFPFILRGDGTALGSSKLLIHYSLILLFALLSIQTVYLATFSFGRELKDKQFFLIDVKPIPRWKFFVGKLFGLSLLNFLLLFFLGLLIWSTIYFFSYQTATEKEQRQFDEQLYTASAGQQPYFSPEVLEDNVKRYYLKMQQEGRIIPGTNERKIKESLRVQLRKSFQYVEPNQGKHFIFLGLPASLRKTDKKVRIRYKIYTSNSQYGFRINTKWIIGTHTRYSAEKISEVGEFIEFSVPANSIEEDGKLRVSYIHEHEAAGSVYFPVEDGLEVLYPQGSFASNYAKTLFLIFLVLILLATLSLFFSTFLSYPVAILTSMFVLMLGMLLDFLREITVQGADNLAQENSSFAGFLYEQYFHLLNLLIPNFSNYLAFENLTTGRFVEWWIIAEAIFFLVILDSGLFIILGCYIFFRKEVAKPIL